MIDRSEPRITPRAVAFGLMSGSLICALMPYNDGVMRTTPLVGNNLPLAATLVVLLFTVCVNAPLHRWRPTSAWSAFELAVSFSIMLVMGAVPSAGLMRYLLPALITPFRLALDNSAYREIVASMHLAPWAFPNFDGDRIGSPLAVGFLDQWTDPHASPYGDWIVPFFAWAVFLGALAWSLMCLVSIVLRQWRDNEHLAFPIASVQLALLEPPAPGRALNRMLRSRAFWLTFAAIVLLHVYNGLAVYFPKHIEPISRGFNFNLILTEPPLSFADVWFRQATVYFAIIGVAFFLSSPVALSLWLFVVIIQCYKMLLGSQTGDANIPGLTEQRHGVGIAFFCAFAWLGRRHWRLVLKQAFRGVRAGEDQGTYLSYPTAFWGVVGGIVLMVGWLVAAGVSFLAASVIVGGTLVVFLIGTRLIAETGLLHSALPISVRWPFEFTAAVGGPRVPADSFYASSIVQATIYDHRETVPVYTAHAMCVLDGTKPDKVRLQRERSLGRSMMLWLFVALAVAYGVSFWSTLWTHYNYAVTLDVGQVTPIDKWGAQDNVAWQVLDPAVNYGREAYPATHSRWANLLFGAGVTAVLSILRLTFAWWPLHPVGYLIYSSFPSTVFWFSIFVGWLAKILVLRFGSARLYEKFKPIALGMIFGETAAGGVWLVVAHVLHALDLPVRGYMVLPN